MGRKVRIEESEFMDRLGKVFSDVGFEGATLSILSKATGLKKASLYHRFPQGKEQMAMEVLARTNIWVEENILKPLRDDGEPRTKIKNMSIRVDELYSGGKQACLLNMLSSAHIHDGPFKGPIRSLFEAWIQALADVLLDAGMSKDIANMRAKRAIILFQGSLVLSRGVGSVQPFKDVLASLPDELLA